MPGSGAGAAGARLLPGAFVSGVILSGALSIGAPAHATAQVTDEQLRERLESLRPVLQEAAAAAEAERIALEEARRVEAQEELARTSATVDTLRVGPVTVVTFDDQAEMLGDVVDRVWRQSFVNVSGSPSLAGTHLVLQWRTPLRPVPRFQDGPVPVRDLSLNRIWTPTRARLEERVRHAIASMLAQDLTPDAPLNVWMTGRWSGTPSTHRSSGDAYRQLAVAPSSAARACVGGDVEACAVALGLELDTPRIARLLSLETRQGMVERGLDAEGYGPDPDAVLVRACLEADDGEACDRALREDVVATGGSPLVGPATVDLFWHAVEVGGAGAWSRVLESASAPPLQALERISGLTGEELIGGWRASVLESRPDVHAELGTAGWASLFWFLVLAGLAMRSTRWRLA